ncbi:MAG: diguanylate cyclase/phosphodiesterase, partial [Gammaproteobacteria bacterium]|nr:diguanylate cyclase/phosphodiesterase [Gammaproteobacteria bacterium]
MLEPQTIGASAQEGPMSDSHVILCVDDEPQVLEALMPTLTKKYLVKTAPSASVALDILRATPAVSVIISDMCMPGMNGAQFLLASRKILPDARRILLTGHPDIPTAVAAVNEGGICRFLTKPCPIESIVEAIDDAIAEYDADMAQRIAIRLASRKSLLEHLDQRRTRECPTELVFCIEIANFDEFTDSYETRTTNQAMNIVVARLRGLFPLARCLAQYRLETFVALMDLDDSAEPAAVLLARHVIRVLEQPIEVDGTALQCRVRVGVARMSIGGGDPRAVLRYAELATREAAKPGNDSVCFYSQESRVRDDLRRATIRALRVAISKDQLHLHYQPIMDLERNCVYSIEALARWEDSRLGVISPGAFIPLAEKSGLMIPLGNRVLN